MAELNVGYAEYKAFEDLSIGSLFRYKGQYFVKISKIGIVNSVRLLHGDLHYVADSQMVWAFNKVDIVEGE